MAHGPHALTIDRPLVGVRAPKTPPAAVKRIRELLPEEDYCAIAAKLNAEGFRTANGREYDERSVGYCRSQPRLGPWGRPARQAERGLKVELVHYEQGHKGQISEL